MSKRILIIDDSPLQLEAMKDIVVKAGFDAFTAADGKEGLEKAKSIQPDLVVLDTILPESDGFEICRKIKEECDPSPKVIIVTGSIDAVDASKAKQAGSDGYTVKTSDFSELMDEINDVIK